MRVRDYLTIVILSCLAGGYLLEYVLSDQFDLVRSASMRHTHSMLWAKDFDRVEADTGQFLIATDLILGNDETYLLDGTLQKGQLLHENIESLHASAHFLPSSNQLQIAAKDVASIVSALQEASALGYTEREQSLNRLLAIADNAGSNLILQLDATHSRADSAIVALRDDLQHQEDNALLLKTLCISMYSIMVLFLWLWANRQLSVPIHRLSQMAAGAKQGKIFLGVDSGPKEVLELSEQTRRLTNSLAYQASHDPLTNLLNRRQFERQLEQQVALVNESITSTSHVLCFIDLDHFKLINDTCGHAAGDELLVKVSRLLEVYVRSGDTVARLGGDEFAILLNSCEIPDALTICNKIRNAILDVRYHYEDRVYKFSASIGITQINLKNVTVAEVVNAADTACKVAKDSGRDRVHVFALGDRMIANKRHEMLMVNQIESAIDERRLELHSQDIVPLNEAANSGDHFEILVRMRNSDGKLVFPDNFLPVVERYQLGARLDQAIIDLVIDWLCDHPIELQNLDTCAINLSGQSVANIDLREFIVSKIEANNFPAHKLCFEITETAAITDVNAAQNFFASLKELGCRFALDDFGSGLSSYGYLKSLDVDVIKIDGQFVKDLATDKVNLATVKSINDLAAALGKETVAEYVENEEIAILLKGLGVDYAQGYHYSKPAPLAERHSDTGAKKVG